MFSLVCTCLLMHPHHIYICIYIYVYVCIYIYIFKCMQVCKRLTSTKGGWALNSSQEMGLHWKQRYGFEGSKRNRRWTKVSWLVGHLKQRICITEDMHCADREFLGFLSHVPVSSAAS